MDVVKARWTTKRQFVGWDSTRHGIVMDTLAEGTGEGTGWRPVELLLLGLAGCTGVGPGLRSWRRSARTSEGSRSRSAASRTSMTSPTTTRTSRSSTP